MTTLTSKVTRETAKRIQGRAVIVSLAPCGSQGEALIGFRLKGTRGQYVARLSDVYSMAALWHGQKMSRAKKEARRMGIPWHQAKKRFIAENSI